MPGWAKSTGLNDDEWRSQVPLLPPVADPLEI
jgi:hypothetical protein